MTARLHRGGVANRARRADRVERVALDRSLVAMRRGDADKALALLVIMSRALDKLRVTS